MRFQAVLQCLHLLDYCTSPVAFPMRRLRQQQIANVTFLLNRQLTQRACIRFAQDAEPKRRVRRVEVR